KITARMFAGSLDASVDFIDPDCIVAYGSAFRLRSATAFSTNNCDGYRKCAYPRKGIQGMSCSLPICSTLARMAGLSSIRIVIVLAALCGCSKVSPSAEHADPKPDFLQAGLDTSVNPGDDFFEYANGGWLKRNPVPPTESSWGIGNVVREDLYTQLRSIS